MECRCPLRRRTRAANADSLLLTVAVAATTATSCDTGSTISSTPACEAEGE